MDEFPYEPATGPFSQPAAQVAGQFEKQQAQGSFTAGQLVVRQGGRVLINLALGEGRSLVGEPLWMARYGTGQLGFTVLFTQKITKPYCLPNCI